MNAPNTTRQVVPSVEDTAHESAGGLLMDAFKSVPRIAPHRDVGTAEAILVAAFALIAKLDAIETTHLEAMHDLQESLDCLGARSNDNEPTLTPTDHESELMYRALEEDYLLNHQAASIDEMDAILRRFKRLAGC